MPPTLVHSFSHSHLQSLREILPWLGRQRANLAEMTTVLQLPVPPGFAITTDEAVRRHKRPFEPRLNASCSQIRG